MSWILEYCRECGAETYEAFNRHAYAMDDDRRKGEQNVPTCGRCD